MEALKVGDRVVVTERCHFYHGSTGMVAQCNEAGLGAWIRVRLDLDGAEELFLGRNLELVTEKVTTTSLNKLGQEFNDHTRHSASEFYGIKRAMEELAEALEAADSHDQQAMVKEYADVILTLAASAAALGLDLDAAVQAKHERNLGAKWVVDLGTGGVKRFKEGKL